MSPLNTQVSVLMYYVYYNILVNVTRYQNVFKNQIQGSWILMCFICNRHKQGSYKGGKLRK